MSPGVKQPAAAENPGGTKATPYGFKSPLAGIVDRVWNAAGQVRDDRRRRRERRDGLQRAEKSVGSAWPGGEVERFATPPLPPLPKLRAQRLFSLNG